MAKRWLIEVVGRGAFPYDMLRYDRGAFATPVDEGVAANERGGTRYVKVLCEDRPTAARWASFLWDVNKEERQ